MGRKVVRSFKGRQVEALAELIDWSADCGRCSASALIVWEKAEVVLTVSKNRCLGDLKIAPLHFLNHSIDSKVVSDGLVGQSFLLVASLTFFDFRWDGANSTADSSGQGNTSEW